MDAVTKGALQAGMPVGGFKIGKEAGEWTASNFHPYLPLQSYLTCRYLVLSEWKFCFHPFVNGKFVHYCFSFFFLWN